MGLVVSSLFVLFNLEVVMLPRTKHLSPTPVLLPEVVMLPWTKHFSPHLVPTAQAQRLPPPRGGPVCRQ